MSRTERLDRGGESESGRASGAGVSSTLNGSRLVPHWLFRRAPVVEATYPKTIDVVWPAAVVELEDRCVDRFERLGDAVYDAAFEDSRKVILFTSCRRAEGRSTLVLTLLRVLGRRPARTVLVDADLSGPMIAKLLGFHPAVGLDDVAEGDYDLDDALLHLAGTSITLLPLRSAIPNPRSFLASPGWTLAMSRLRREFDLVLLDGSPLFAGLSAAALHKSVDAAVLVRGLDATGERDLVRAREVLEAGGVPLLGCAETFADEAS